MQKVEDPILRIIRQQQASERAVGAAVKAPNAKQRDSGDSDFHYQGPQTYGGGNFGYGTKDRMPGTTPMIPPAEPGMLDQLLDILKIKKKGGKGKKPNRTKIKAKGTGNLI